MEFPARPERPYRPAKHHHIDALNDLMLKCCHGTAHNHGVFAGNDTDIISSVREPLSPHSYLSSPYEIQ
jgi:hypothetical protein